MKYCGPAPWTDISNACALPAHAVESSAPLIAIQPRIWAQTNESVVLERPYEHDTPMWSDYAYAWASSRGPDVGNEI